ncbi:hypothetical protein ACFOON_16525 [Novosphingobium piscinae]|uniref:Uncharacterized protein n=1 Tax=Novosphingobium piscinae TaxID=1507448 RepID=A0A7X1FYM4_9SPHN|nr:hypothetical protein [Novosphingobium piscinae]MBC2669396.1 hypothetical protein [Novosphingobium piscinae]
MNAPLDELAEARAAREATLGAVQERLSAIEAALAGQSVGARVRHDAVTRVKGAAEETIAVARESRWVVVGTAALLALWVLRAPLVRVGRSLATRLDQGEPRAAWQRFREWTSRKAKL